MNNSNSYIIEYVFILLNNKYNIMLYVATLVTKFIVYYSTSDEEFSVFLNKWSNSTNFLNGFVYSI